MIDWRVDGAPVLRSRPHGGAIRSLRAAEATSPFVAVASEDGCASVLGIHDLQSLARLEGHIDYASCVGWLRPPSSQGGEAVLITGGWDKQLLRHTTTISYAPAQPVQ